jgi:hypothetical protein
MSGLERILISDAIDARPRSLRPVVAPAQGLTGAGMPTTICQRYDVVGSQVISATAHRTPWLSRTLCPCVWPVAVAQRNPLACVLCTTRAMTQCVARIPWHTKTWTQHRAASRRVSLRARHPVARSQTADAISPSSGHEVAGRCGLASQVAALDRAPKGVSALASALPATLRGLTTPGHAHQQTKAGMRVNT